MVFERLDSSQRRWRDASRLRVVSAEPIDFCLLLMLDCTFDLLVEEEEVRGAWPVWYCVSGLRVPVRRRARVAASLRASGRARDRGRL